MGVPRIWRAPLEVRRERSALRARCARADGLIAACSRGRRRELSELARELERCRERIALLTGRPGCCASCASRIPPHPGREELSSVFPGGHCCSTQTARVTSEIELAVLRLAGHRLECHRTVRLLAGCVFRAPTGCLLSAAARPSLCVRYMCRDLIATLHRAGVLAEVISLCDELEGGVAQIEEALLAGPRG